MRFIQGLAVAALLFLGACASAPAHRTEAPLVLVLLDGFRADYIDRGVTPAISALAADGVRGPMRPSTPSVSAPNHYTLVTGLYPDHHGMVDNTFYDAELGMYGMDEASYNNPRFFEGATPLWVTAERQNVRSASAFWGGPNLPIHGVRASLSMPFDERTPNEARVDQVLTWLALPPAERPGLVLLYFGSVDTAGHIFGPDAPQTNGAIAAADSAIGRLVSGLEARGQEANIVLVADHGMTDLSEQRVILLEDLVDVAAVQETSYGATLGVNPRAGREAEVERALLRTHEHMTCWRKSEIPARYHYGTHTRVPAIFCIAEKGWTVVTPAARARYPMLFRGNHGFDPALPEMAALFVANGPAFRQGVTVSAFDNVDLYPMLARVLGIRAEVSDGNAATLAAALR